MPTIVSRGPHQFQARVRVRGQPPVSKTFTMRADAEKWARQIQAELERGTYLPRRTAEVTTIADLAKTFEEEFAPHHYRGSAWKFKLTRLREKLGSYSLASLTPRVVSSYRDRRLAEADSRYSNQVEAPRVSPATVKSELDLLSKLIGYAQKELGIALPNGNPVLGVRKPRSSNGRERRLSAIERVRLLEECERSRNPWLRPAVELALETAMRQGELLSLRWEHVDLRSGVAILPTTKNGDARAVPLTGAAIRALKGLPRSINGAVLPTQRMTLYKAFVGAAERAGCANLTFHDLRHEALSTLAELGDLNVLELAAVSGHRSLQVLKRYTHLQAGKLAQRIDAARRKFEAG
ncbi:MAG: site-specific integrase [Rhodocyclaceae bacterium]|nr:site-specific integrase [Rhodocyclaceae bacterium]